MKVIESGGLKIDGSAFKGKPSDAITVAVWVYLYPTGSIHQVLAVSGSTGNSK